MLTSSFDYQLPPELIAQRAAEPRDAARLLVAGCEDGEPEHAHVRDLGRWLRPGDLLVLNRTKVFPARLLGRKDSGGHIELLLVHRDGEARDGRSPDGGERWQGLVRGKVRPGAVLAFDGCSAVVHACLDDGTRIIDFPAGVDVVAFAERRGKVPLPPYIRRSAEEHDAGRYQSVFAESLGSVAAPTAALHFTRALLGDLGRDGVDTAYVDLAIGPGTFQPVTCDQVEDHQIHAEYCSCPPATVEAIQRCRERGGRVVAVGTTVVRTLETAARQPGGLREFAGWSRLFLHPPQRLAVVDALLTNFHLPRSSLLMLVSCLTGAERLLALYAAAISQEYRFYSYGDAMLLLPKARASA